MPPEHAPRADQLDVVALLPVVPRDEALGAARGGTPMLPNFSSNAEADAFLRRPYRDGWTL